MARDLCTHLNSDLNLANFQAYAEPSAILKKLKSQQLGILAS